MLDDLFESFDLPPSPGRRGQTVIRVLVGLVGALLALAGLYKGIVEGFGGAGLMFRAAGCLVFGFLLCLCMFNVALHRPWRWPGLGFVASLVAIFLVRVIFGA